jgi:hypothetical protein
MVAWLITWNWHDKDEEDVTLVLNYRFSETRIKNIVELLYVSKYLSDDEKMLYASNNKANPYPAEFDAIDGIKYGGRITCGHNPWLHARKVDSLKEDKETGKLTWRERPIPEMFYINAAKMRNNK